MAFMMQEVLHLPYLTAMKLLFVRFNGISVQREKKKRERIKDRFIF